MLFCMISIELRPPVVERQAAIAAPMKRHRAAAVRDDELQRRKILEQVGEDELHERHGVGVEIVRAGGVHRRIAAAADVDHRRHVQLDHLFVERIPPFVGERRRVEVAARRIGIEIAADEAKLVDAALELGGREFFGGTPGDCGNWHTPTKFCRIERARRDGSGRCRSATIRGSRSRRRRDGPCRRRAARRS